MTRPRITPSPPLDAPPRGVATDDPAPHGSCAACGRRNATRSDLFCIPCRAELDAAWGAEVVTP